MQHHIQYRLQDNRVHTLQSIIREIEDLMVAKSYSSTFMQLLKNDLSVVKEELNNVEYNTEVIYTVFNNLEIESFYYSKKAWSRNNDKPWPRLLRQFNPIHDIKYVWAINKIRNEIIYGDQRMLKPEGFTVNLVGQINVGQVYSYCKDIEQFNLINK